MSGAKRLPVDELLRLACYYAERDQEEFARCVEKSDPEEYAKSLAFVAQVRAYRLKRWGRTRLEKAIEKATPTPIDRIACRPNSPFQSPQ